MNARLQKRISLYTIIGALIVAVICAIIGAAGDKSISGASLGTAGLTLLLAGFIHACLRLCEKERSRLAGFISLGIVLGIWCLTLLAIWSDTLRWGSAFDEERFMSMALALFVSWAPLGIGGRALTEHVWRASGFILLAGFSAFATIWIIGLWTSRDGDLIASIIIPLGSAAIVAALLMRRSSIPCSIRGGLCVMAIAASLAWSMLLFSSSDPGRGPILTMVLAGLGLPLATGIINTFVDLSLPRARWLRGATACTVIIAVTLTCLLIWSSIDGPRAWTRWMARLAASGVLISLACCVAIAIIYRSGRAFVESGHSLSLEVRCPRCRRSIELGQGDRACPWCELKFRLAFEPPDCRGCGQPLAPNFPTRCPECGTMVVASDSTSAGAGEHQSAT